MLLVVPVIASGQSFKQNGESGGLGHGEVFSPFKDNPKDSTKKSVVVPKEEVDTALEILRANGEDAYVIGEIVASDEKVVIC